MQCIILCDIAKFIMYYYHNLHNWLFILSKLPQYLAEETPSNSPDSHVSSPATTVMSAKGLQRISKRHMKPLIKGI